MLKNGNNLTSWSDVTNGEKIMLKNGNNLTSWASDVSHAFDTYSNQIINRLFQPEGIGDLKNKITNSGFPRLDVYTTDTEYVVEGTVPGYNPDDITVEITTEGDNRYLKLSGKSACTNAASNFTTKEIRRSQFMRTVLLPDTLTGDPEAEIKDGILRLAWKLPEKPKPTSETKVISLKKS